MVLFTGSCSESLSDELSLDESDELEAEEEETDGAFFVAFVFVARSASESELLSLSEPLEDESLDALEDCESDSGRDFLAGAESDSDSESVSDSLEDDEAEDEEEDVTEAVFFFDLIAVAVTCFLESESEESELELESEESELELEADELELEDTESAF